MKKKKVTRHFIALSAVLGLSSCAVVPMTQLDTRTNEVLTAMCHKLESAKTLRVHASRAASPGFLAGVDVAESARGVVSVRRPYEFAAHMNTNHGKREIGYDGNTMTIVDRAARTHSVVTVYGDIDSALSRIEQDYGVTPPVGVLLTNRPRRVLLQGVQVGKHLGAEKVNGIECDLMAFEQPKLSWKLWVARTDSLPRRISIAYENERTGAPRTMDAVITKWELDPRLTDLDVTVAPPAGSQNVEMVPLPR